MIRKLNKTDLPQMLKIWNLHHNVLTSSHIRHTIKSLENWYETRYKPNHKYFGRLKGKIEYFGMFEKKWLKAFIVLKYTRNSLWIKWLAAGKNEKGKGYGKALVRFAIKKSAGKNLFCEVMAHNYETINFFFFKCGFRIIKFNKNLQEFVMQYKK